MRRAMLAIALCACLGSSVARAQQATPRDSRADALIGRSVLGGVVLADEPGTPPLRRVQVGVLGTENGLIRIASSDDNGRFVLAALPAGRYLLSVTRPPYVDMLYGATQPGRPGTAIALGEGEQRTDLVLKMIRGAVITGTVTDEQGQPAVDLGVDLVQPQEGPSEMQMLRTLLGTPRAITDDRGTFRFSGVAPGKYVVSVTPPDSGGTEVRQVTPEEVRTATQALRDPQRPGVAPAASNPPASTVLVARGGAPLILLPAGSPAGAMMMGSPGQSTFSPVYYPGTTNFAEAAFIAVGAAEERRWVDLVARRVPTTRIEGVVYGPDGQPAANVNVTARLTDRGDAITLPRLLGMMSSLMSRTQSDGRFVVTGLAPGTYALEARTASGSALALLAGRMGGPAASPSTVQLWARDEFVATGQPLSGYVLRLQPGLTLSGRVGFDAVSATPPKDFASVSVSVRPAGDAGLLTSLTMGAAQMNENGSFTVTGLVPGHYVVMATVATAGAPADSLTWLGQTIVIDGRDFSDLPIEIRADQELKDVRITMTDRQQELSGTLQDPAGRPAPDFTVVLFAADRKYWMPSSRRILTARPATDGKFAFQGPLGPPPGDYLLAAVTDLATGQQFDPAFLDAISKAAVPITLAPGQKKVQDLRIVR